MTTGRVQSDEFETKYSKDIRVVVNVGNGQKFIARLEELRHGAWTKILDSECDPEVAQHLLFNVNEDRERQALRVVLLGDLEFIVGAVVQYNNMTMEELHSAMTST